MYINSFSSDMQTEQIDTMPSVKKKAIGTMKFSEINFSATKCPVPTFCGVS